MKKKEYKIGKLILKLINYKPTIVVVEKVAIPRCLGCIYVGTNNHRKGCKKIACMASERIDGNNIILSKYVKK
jgi:hypothetical protein